MQKNECRKAKFKPKITTTNQSPPMKPTKRPKTQNHQKRLVYSLMLTITFFGLITAQDGSTTAAEPSCVNKNCEVCDKTLTTGCSKCKKGKAVLEMNKEASNTGVSCFDCPINCSQCNIEGCTKCRFLYKFQPSTVQCEFMLVFTIMVGLSVLGTLLVFLAICQIKGIKKSKTMQSRANLGKAKAGGAAKSTKGKAKDNESALDHLDGKDGSTDSNISEQSFSVAEKEVRRGKRKQEGVEDSIMFIKPQRMGQGSEIGGRSISSKKMRKGSRKGRKKDIEGSLDQSENWMGNQSVDYEGEMVEASKVNVALGGGSRGRQRKRHRMPVPSKKSSKKGKRKKSRQDKRTKGDQFD